MVAQGAIAVTMWRRPDGKVEASTPGLTMNLLMEVRGYG